MNLVFVVNEIKISIRAYAKQLGVDEAAVRKAISAKKITTGYDTKAKKIIPSKADREWGFSHKNPKPQRGVSKSKVAEKLNTALPAEGKSVKGKKPVTDDGEQSFEELENFTYTDLIAKVNIHPSLSYAESLRRKEILGIALDKMKLEEMNEMLLRKVDVDKALFSFGVEFKKAMLNIGPRCINDIRAANSDVEAINILTSEIQLALSHIPEQINLTKN